MYVLSIKIVLFNIKKNFEKGVICVEWNEMCDLLY